MPQCATFATFEEGATWTRAGRNQAVVTGQWPCAWVGWLPRGATL